MRSALLTLLTSFCLVAPVLADSGHDHQAVPTLMNQTTTTVTMQENTVTLTFGPIDLPAGHDGDLRPRCPSMPFSYPKTGIWWGIKLRSSPKMGRPSPRTISITS